MISWLRDSRRSCNAQPVSLALQAKSAVRARLYKEGASLKETHFHLRLWKSSFPVRVCPRFRRLA